jgi:hypothetical protein
MDMIMKAKKQMLAASRAKTRATTFSPTLPGASDATKEVAARPLKEKALKKIQVNPATIEEHSELSHEELLEKAVTSASRLYDRRIRKKLNRGSLDEAVEYVNEDPSPRPPFSLFSTARRSLGSRAAFFERDSIHSERCKLLEQRVESRPRNLTSISWRLSLLLIDSKKRSPLLSFFDKIIPSFHQKINQEWINY